MFGVCCCNTQGLASRCHTGDIHRVGQALSICAFEKVRQENPPRLTSPHISGLPSGLPTEQRLSLVPSPKLLRLKEFLPGLPAHPPGRVVNPTMRTREPSEIMSRSVSSAELRINKICTFQAMENANCFYSATSVAGVLC